jgi:hypothetical protein
MWSGAMVVDIPIPWRRFELVNFAIVDYSKQSNFAICDDHHHLHFSHDKNRSYLHPCGNKNYGHEQTAHYHCNVRKNFYGCGV